MVNSNSDLEELEMTFKEFKRKVNEIDVPEDALVYRVGEDIYDLEEVIIISVDEDVVLN